MFEQQRIAYWRWRRKIWKAHLDQERAAKYPNQKAIRRFRKGYVRAGWKLIDLDV